MKRNPGSSLDNFEMPKAIMWMIGHAIDGRYGDLNACLTTVIRYSVLEQHSR